MNPTNSFLDPFLEIMFGLVFNRHSIVGLLSLVQQVCLEHRPMLNIFHRLPGAHPMIITIKSWHHLLLQLNA